MCRMKISIILLALLEAQLLFSQADNYSSPVIPPSPTSAVFRQYGNHQPSLSSGTIHVPIPLYELKTNEFTLPFTLYYNTSGINVADRPFPCGYGWVFSPGLRVTRTIFGRPDDHFPMRSLSVIPADELGFQLLKRGIIDKQQSSSHGIAPNELYDTQKDLFTLHLPSGNHTFLINKTGDSYEALSIGNLLRIEFYKNQQMGSINGFKVTDENGVIYKFGMYENENDLSAYIEYVGTDVYCTAWMLREIVLPDNTSINLTWKRFSPNNDYSIGDASMVIGVSDFVCCTVGEPAIDISDLGGFVNLYRYDHLSMLEKVVFPSGEIDISYKQNANPFMTKLEVKDKNGIVCKKVDFLYGEGDRQESALLKSLKVNEEAYRFTYNDNRYENSTNSLDYWGFYNGKKNGTLIPKMTLGLFTSSLQAVTGPNESRVIGSADRSVDAERMKAFMLERIDYPTGGYSEFKYEPHRFADQYPLSTEVFPVTPPPINMGGGLRVSEIRTRSDASSPLVVKTYKYGLNESGLANVLSVPTLDTFIDEVGSQELGGGGYKSARRMVINPFSCYSKYFVNNSIWYDNVSEYVNGVKTDFVFENAFDAKYSYDLYRSIKRAFTGIYNSLFTGGPRLISQTAYKKNGSVYSQASRSVWRYKKISGGDVLNWMIERMVIDGGGGSGGPDFRTSSPILYGVHQNFPFPYNLFSYRTYLDYYEVESKRDTLTTDFGNITASESYEYKNDPQIWKKTLGTSSPAKQLVTEYRYPYDYKDAVYLGMTEKNMISPVIEEITYNGGLETKRTKTGYMSDPSLTHGLIRPACIQLSSTGPAGLRSIVNFDKYDMHGNLLQETLPDGTSNSYLWSYGYQHPVAKIVNADYNAVNAALNASGISATALASNPNPDDSVIDDVRKIAKQLPRAMVSVYKYKPLVGIVNETQPIGLSNSYGYDDFGRLQSVAYDNKVLTSYAYNHKGWGEPMRINVPVSESYDMVWSVFSHVFSATVTNNIGNLTYDWCVRDSSGVILASATNVTASTFSVTLQSQGEMTLSCVAKDSFTGKTVTTTQSFILKVATEFRNVQKTGDSNSSYRRAYADIYCANACTIRFEINYSRTDANVYVKLGSSDVISMSDYGGSLTRDISFSQGWSYADISIEGYDPSAIVDIRIISVSSENVKGGNELLYLWP